VQTGREEFEKVTLTVSIVAIPSKAASTTSLVELNWMDKVLFCLKDKEKDPPVAMH